MSVSSVFGMGGNSVIARLLGEGKTARARNVFNFCNYAMIISGIITLIAGIVFSAPIADLLGADDINRAYTIEYLRGIFIGAPFIIFANGATNIFRSVMLINQSTIGIALGNGINIILDYVFICVLRMGTFGAALATSIGFTAASVYYIICILHESRKGNDIITLLPKDLNLDARMIREIVSIGIPGALVTILMSVSNIVLNNYIAIYGSNAVASYGIAYKIGLIPVMLSVGLAQGVAPLIGYCYGAGEETRMNRTFLTAAIYGFVLGAVITAAFLLAANPLSSLFLKDKTLIEQTAHMLRLLSLSAPTLGIINITNFYYQALGKAMNSLIITILRNIALFIPCVTTLNYLLQLNGVVAAQPVTETLLMFVCITMYTYDMKKSVRKSNTKNMINMQSIYPEANYENA